MRTRALKSEGSKGSWLGDQPLRDRGLKRFSDLFSEPRGIKDRFGEGLLGAAYLALCS